MEGGLLTQIGRFYFDGEAAGAFGDEVTEGGDGLGGVGLEYVCIARRECDLAKIIVSI